MFLYKTCQHTGAHLTCKGRCACGFYSRVVAWNGRDGEGCDVVDGALGKDARHDLRGCGAAVKEP